jgi:hypothetical protein
MVAQMPSPRKAARAPKVSANRVRQMLLELTYRLHTTRVVERTPIRSEKRRLVRAQSI